MSTEITQIAENEEMCCCAEALLVKERVLTTQRHFHSTGIIKQFTKESKTVFFSLYFVAEIKIDLKKVC